LSPRRVGTRRAGFTLVEMLVVIGIIVMLAGITLPAIFRSQVSARETYCKNNLSQIGKGLFSYMVNWDRRFIANRPPALVTSTRQIPDPVFTSFDDLSPLWGVPAARFERKGGTFRYVPVVTESYVQDVRAFNCPTTRDVAGRLKERTEWWKELRYKRDGKALTFTWSSGYTFTTSTPTPPPQLSYEYAGEFNPSMQYIGINSNKAWLAHDDDSNIENTQAILVNKDYKGLELTSKSNHGKRGGNMLFLDGRVQWIPSIDWVRHVIGGIREWETVTTWSMPSGYYGIP